MQKDTAKTLFYQQKSFEVLMTSGCQIPKIKITKPSNRDNNPHHGEPAAGICLLERVVIYLIVRISEQKEQRTTIILLILLFETSYVNLYYFSYQPLLLLIKTSILSI